QGLESRVWSLKSKVGGSESGETEFEAQFRALLDYVRRQKWADTNRVAWVGFSLGAQRMLAFALAHPDLRPGLIVRVSGGWIPELESKVWSLKSKVGDP